MIHRENICEAATILLKLLKGYDENHPEVTAKADIALIMIKKIAKMSAISYYEGLGIIQEAAESFADEWNSEKSIDDFSETESEEDDD